MPIVSDGCIVDGEPIAFVYGREESQLVPRCLEQTFYVAMTIQGSSMPSREDTEKALQNARNIVEPEFYKMGPVLTRESLTGHSSKSDTLL